jgi:isopropylmalate/homocitrate/citramalate synthase
MENLEKAGLAVNYNKVPDTKSKSLPKRVHIWDETLRDGEQTPGVALTIDEKIEIAKKLDEVGTAIVAVGFPAVSEEEKRAVTAVAKEGLSKASVAAPARAVITDVEACIESGVKEVPIFIATSDFRLKYQLRMTVKSTGSSSTTSQRMLHVVIWSFCVMPIGQPLMPAQIKSV